MAYNLKYTGKELEEKLDSIDSIPTIIANMLVGNDFVTNENLICILKDYAPADYHTIPIDGVTIYWDKGLLKAAASGEKCLWELRYTENGKEYIYSKYPVLTQDGITMYAGNNSEEEEEEEEEDNPDTILNWSDIPIDGKTIYWGQDIYGNDVLKAKAEIDFLKIPIDEDTIYWGYKNGKEVLKAKVSESGGQEDSNLFRGHYDSNGNLLYIEALADVAVNGGLTMYVDNGTIDLPSLYDGLLIDNDTIYWGYDSKGNKILKANVPENSGLDEGQLKEYLDRYQYLTPSKGDERYLKLIGGTITGNLNVNETLTTKVLNAITASINGSLGVEGEVAINSSSGIVLNGSTINYDANNQYWIIDGNLLVKGGISFYSSDSPYDSFSIMEGIRTDGKTIHVNDEGYLEVIGGTGGGVVDEDSIREIIESYKYLDKIETLTIYNSSNSTILSYDGKSPKSLTLNKNLIGLSNVENTALSTWTGSTNINKVGTITSGTWQGTKIGLSYLPTATTSEKGVASFDQSYFSVSSGKVTFTGANVQIVGSLPGNNYRTKNTLYVITG